MNADTSDRTPFLFNDAIHYSPAWSPDGMSIAFSIDFSAEQEIYFLSPFNVDLFRPLFVPTNAVAFAPAFSPDGSKLSYNNLTGTGGDLVIIDANGSNPIFLVDRTVNGNSSQPDWVGFNTSAGSNITVVSGTTTISFSGVTTGGTTSATPIDPSDAGTLPGGYSFGAGFPAYEITTTASYTAPVTVCLQVPAISTQTAFNSLSLFHNEGGVLVDRTFSRDFPSRTICAQTTSLSPFAVAQALAPTAAPAYVAGRISTADGRGVSNARVSISGPDGDSLMALTNAFGYYRFDSVQTGQTYFITVRHKQFQFEPRLINVLDNITDADFVAVEKVQIPDVRAVW